MSELLTTNRPPKRGRLAGRTGDQTASRTGGRTADQTGGDASPVVVSDDASPVAANNAASLAPNRNAERLVPTQAAAGLVPTQAAAHVVVAGDETLPFAVSDAANPAADASASGLALGLASGSASDCTSGCASGPKAGPQGSSESLLPDLAPGPLPPDPTPTAPADPLVDPLVDAIACAYHDPLGFVRFIFPWGEGELAECSGPDVWQAEVLRAIGSGTLTPGEAVRVATASGHGIGKTALVAWIILWAMSTRPHLAGVVTANTGAQLTNKTWRELALWHKRALNAAWFRWTATKFYQVDHPETWFVSAVPWNKERPEAFAGLHAEHVLVIFDEASAIDDAIWDTAEGAMTTPGAMWAVFGNPTRNSGRFHGCFHRMRHRWNVRQVDSRTAMMANQAQLKQWVDDYGEDSDFVRIRVRGVFPRAGSDQLITTGLIEAAVRRNLAPEAYEHAPKVLGVDVARFGDDQSVMIRRQGLAAFSPRTWRGIDTMTLAGHVAREIETWQPDAVFVDQGGVGGGVVDRLRQLGHRVIGVDFGGKPLDDAKYANKRAEMWCLMREWLEAGGSLPDDAGLAMDLGAPEYGFTGDKGQIVLEKKKDMKARGLASPDAGDALALTFALAVRPKTALRQLLAENTYTMI